MSRAVVFFSTCGSRAIAKTIATQLVEQRLAACVNIVDGVTSIYRWQGEIQNDVEALLIIKSVAEHSDAISVVIKANSGYELPELVMLEISGGSPAYLEWLKGQTSS